MTKRRPSALQKRQKLSALFERGKEIRFFEGGHKVGPFLDDEGHPIPLGDEEIAVWVAPPNPMQREEAIRESQAIRAKATLNARRIETSKEYEQVESVVANATKEELIDQILQMDDSDRHRRASRDLLAEEEWEDIDDLRDALRKFEEEGAEEDDEEWKGVLEREAEFDRQLRKLVADLRAAQEEALGIMDRDVLEERCRDRSIDLLGTQVFLDEYESQMLLFACRDDEDHSRLFFDSIESLRSSPAEVQMACSQILAEFISDPGEAKNSQGVAPSSEQSELPAEPEISEVSTQEDATE